MNAREHTLDFDAAVADALSGPPSPQQWQPKKLNYSHDALIDYIIAHPSASRGEIAAVFDRSTQWVTLVWSSDAFKARMAQRRGEVVDPELRLTLRERFDALTHRSLEVLQEKLSAPAAKVSDQLALQAAALGARSLGLGQAAPPVAVVTAEERLASLAHRLMALQKRPPQEDEVIDV